MDRPSRASAFLVITCATGIIVALAVGIALRLEDPRSTPVIAAEDPYTHMALVREHLRDGRLEGLSDDSALYPPGLHAYLASVWVFSGTDLFDLVRFGPVILGAIGVLGVAFLLFRFEHPVAAVTGAMAYAVAPEVIFRTTMMSPTALDLALLPFLFLALLSVLGGAMRWVVPAAVLLVFLTLSHPWMVAVVGLTGIAFLLLVLAVPWTQRHRHAPSPRGLVAAAAVVGGATLLSIPVSAIGGTGLVGDLLGEAPSWLWYALVVATVLAVSVALVLLLAPRLRALLLPTGAPRATRTWTRWATSAMLAAVLLAVVVPALQRGMEDFVDLPRGFGIPILAFATAAFVALPFIAGPAAHAGAAMVLVTAPFVLYNPLASPYWPHRAAVFLGFGLVLLAGVACAAIWRVTVRGFERLQARRPRTATMRARTAGFVLVPSLVATLVLATAIYAGTPVPYAGGWYRLYHPCEYDAMLEVAALADEDADALIVTGDWQAKLVLAAMATNASRVWLKPEFFVDTDDREDLMAITRAQGRTLYTVVDGYLLYENPDADTTFLASDDWIVQGEYCAGMGVQQARIQAYVLREVPA